MTAGQYNVQYVRATPRFPANFQIRMRLVNVETAEPKAKLNFLVQYI